MFQIGKNFNLQLTFIILDFFYIGNAKDCKKAIIP